MRIAVLVVMAAGALTSCAGTSVSTTSSTQSSATVASVVAEGKVLAFTRTKGHCLACHEIVGGELPGTVGPALVNVKSRYPDKIKLRAQISDARVNNPNTIMPPFGPNNLLTEQEIDKVVEFVMTL